MNKEHTMNYKLLIYVFNIMLCIFSLSGINFEKIIKKNRVVETKLLILIIGLVLASHLTNFIFDFLKISKII